MSGCRHKKKEIITKRWVYYSHGHDEIEQKFTTRLDGMLRTNNIQHHTRDFHNSKLSDLEHQCKQNQAEDQQLLNDYFTAFNGLFFFKALTNWTVPLRVVHRHNDIKDEHPWEDNERSSSRVYGYAKDSRPHIARGQEAYSGICIFGLTFPQEPEKRLLHYLGTLLHEMTHAFIILYTCYCPECKPKFQKHEGKAGHGTTWHILATKIEAFTKEVLGLDVDLGIAEVMDEE